MLLLLHTPLSRTEGWDAEKEVPAHESRCIKKMRSGERLLTAAFPKKIVRIFLAENGISILALLRTRAGYVVVINGVFLLREEHSISREGVRPEFVRERPEIVQKKSRKSPGKVQKKSRKSPGKVREKP